MHSFVRRIEQLDTPAPADVGGEDLEPQVRQAIRYVERDDPELARLLLEEWQEQRDGREAGNLADEPVQ
ncbi:MAG TPA: hypothetical protein VIF43_03710 [Patescibacteria group bacterium]|jgi:hypothetical protein